MSSVIEDTQPSGSASLSLLQRISYGSLDVAGICCTASVQRTFYISTQTLRALALP